MAVNNALSRVQPVPSPQDLAERIRGERERLGLTKSDVARLLGVTPHSYRQLEESANPKVGTLVALVRKVGMNPQALLPELFHEPVPGG